MMAQTTPRFSPKDEDPIDDSQEKPFISRGCCCFWNFSGSNPPQSDNWERVSSGDVNKHESINRSWWDKGVKPLKKVREWSELVAGPKWKTFIRRFNKSTGRSKPGKFQYDPLSYALNFDEGTVPIEQFEDDRVFRDFSSRYAAIPGQNGQLKEATLFT